MSTVTTASKQWASRPDDERFTSLIDLGAHFDSLKARSTSRVTSSRQLQAEPAGDEQHEGLIINGLSTNGPVVMSHWSFGQLAQRAGAPAGYMRELPSPLAADCINYGLRFHRDVEELGVLYTKDESGDFSQMRAVTGPNYGRIYNSTIVKQLINRFGDGVTGDFKVPGEFGKDVKITKRNTTIYGSDRDMFVFLADEKNRIELPNRRDGQSGSLAKGFYVYNSEVGAGSYGIAMFLFDFVCMNRIIWGVAEFKEVRGIHTKGAPDRWIEQVAPAIEAYSQASVKPVEAVLLSAQSKKVDDMNDFLRKRFTSTQVTGIKAAYLADEQRPLSDTGSLWDATTAVTAYARGINYQDERVAIEREGGKILNLAA